MGDFNYPGIDWSSGTCKSAVENEFLETVRDCYLTQCIHIPSRGRGFNNPSLIDLILTNDEDTVNNIRLEAPLGKSDHSVTKYYSNITIDNKQCKERQNYNKGNFNLMSEMLNQT